MVSRSQHWLHQFQLVTEHSLKVATNYGNRATGVVTKHAVFRPRPRPGSSGLETTAETWTKWNPVHSSLETMSRDHNIFLYHCFYFVYYFWTGNGYQLIYTTGLVSSYCFCSFADCHCILHTRSYTICFFFANSYPAQDHSSLPLVKPIALTFWLSFIQEWFWKKKTAGWLRP